MNTKRILVLLMTFVMLVSTFAPTLSVFAEELHNHETEKETLEYVSLGDSMTNGIGLDGYDSTGSNGYLEVAPDSYPAQFTEWLKEFTGKDVNLTQLATSAVRVEDLYYILTRGTENEIEPDFWTFRELLTNPNRWGHHDGPREEEHPNNTARNDLIASVHQEAVKNADIITLATGNGNFGVFFMNRIMNLVGFGSEDELALDYEHYGHYTIENALALCEADEKLVALVNDMYNKALTYLEGMNFPMDLMERMAGLMAYTTASYVVYTIKTIDLIVEMNPDVTIIMLPLINNGLDFNFSITLHGIKKDFNAGDFLGMLYTPLNAFLAGYSTAKQLAGEFEEATFLYAELPVDENGETIQVETFAQAFDDLYAPIGPGMNDETYPSNRLFCHNRFIPDILDFVFAMLQLPYVSFNEYDVRAFELAKVNGTLGEYQVALQNEAINAGITSAGEIEEYVVGKLTSMSMYLGFVEAILGAMKNAGTVETAPNMNFDDIAVDPETGFSMVTLLAGLTDGLMTKVEHKMNDLAMEQYGELIMGGHIDGATAALLVMPEAMSIILHENGTLETLLALYGKLKLAWGLSAHPSVKGHDTLTESLVNAYESEYTTQDETLENLKELGNLVVEYYDEAYEYGYSYVDNNGYIDLSVEAVDKAIDALLGAIDEVNAGTLGVTEELKEKLVAELEATIETLEELRDVLANDSAKDVEGLVAAVFALENDLYAHLNGVYAVLEQAGIDVNQLVILPAISEAIRVVEEEVVPAIVATAEAFANAVVEYVQAKLEAVYTVLETVLGIPKKVYSQIVDTIVRIQLQIGEQVENIVVPVVDAYLTLVATLTDIYGSVEEAIKVATGIVSDIVEKAGDTLADAIKNYDKILNLINAYYEGMENAVVVAGQIFSYVYDFATENFTKERLEAIYNGIVTIVTETYGATHDAYLVATQIYAFLVETFIDVDDVSYLVSENSLYVSLGNDVYGSKLAEMLKLGDDKYYNFAIGGDYLDTVANADLVTIKFDNGETIKFALSQIQNYGTPLSWDKYLDAEGQVALANALASLKTGLIESGKAAELAVVLGGLLENNTSLPGFNLNLTEENVAEIIAYVVESSLYAYAEFVERAMVTLENVYAVAPEAIVVITGVQNPVNDVLNNLNSDIAKYAKAFNLVFDAINVQFMAVAFADENTIFVGSENADDIYDALNVVFENNTPDGCQHVYDSCLDKDCNICGETRKAALIHKYEDCEDTTCNNEGCTYERIAPGHKYDDCVDAVCNVCQKERVAPGHIVPEYKYDNNATCGVDGTETGTCDVCKKKITRDVPGTALEHNMLPATCTAPSTCEHCGLTEGEKLPHVYGDWKVVREPSNDTQGFKERTCIYCGDLQGEGIPALGGLSTGAIVAISVGGVVAVGGIVAAVYFFILKKKRV